MAAAQSGVNWYEVNELPQRPPAPVGASLAAVPVLANLRCFCKCETSSRADILRGLAVVSGGVWTRCNHTQVLTDRADLAPLLLLSGAELGKKQTKACQSLKAMSAREADLLRRFRVLTPLDLSLSRRAALRDVAQLFYVRCGDYSSEALALRGVRLELTNWAGVGKAPNWSLMLSLPRRNGQLRECLAMAYPEAPVDVPPEDERGTRVREHRLELPEKEPPVVAAPADLPPLVLEDPRLSRPVIFTGGTVLEAAAALGSAVPLDVLLSTQLATARIRVQSPHPVARDLCAGIAAATGGSWFLVNKLLVLRPDLGVEQAAQLTPEVRNEWVQSAAEQVAGTLEPDQRRLLEMQGELALNDLDPHQQGLVKWMIRLVFVASPETRRLADGLKGTRMKLAGDEKQKWLSFEVPRISLPPSSVRAVPLK